MRYNDTIVEFTPTGQLQLITKKPIEYSRIVNIAKYLLFTIPKDISNAIPYQEYIQRKLR